MDSDQCDNRQDVVREIQFESRSKCLEERHKGESCELDTDFYDDEDLYVDQEYRLWKLSEHSIMKTVFHTFQRHVEPRETTDDKEMTPMQELRRSLPIFPYRDDFLNALKNHSILIVDGETGSGKTTQIPQYLYEAGYCKYGKQIVSIQPTELAAMSVATQVAREMGEDVGNKVGYSVRSGNCISQNTVIKFTTNEMLLSEILLDQKLLSYRVIIMDEAHERTLHADVLSGLLAQIVDNRTFKLLVLASSFDADKYSILLDEAPIYNIHGRRFPVEIFYAKSPEDDYVDACVRTVLKIHATENPGDILVFLTGQDDIEEAQKMLAERIQRLGTDETAELVILPFHANVPSDTRAKIFETTPPGTRKVILASHIAETSVTIDNVIYVVDSGYCEQTFYDATTVMTSSEVVPISKALANQRAARAGRVASGKCFRLYTALSYKTELEEETQPEIQRVNLTHVVLLIKVMQNIQDLKLFHFLHPPPYELLESAIDELRTLGALNRRGKLTNLGRRMAESIFSPAIRIPEDPISSDETEWCNSLCFDM